MRSNRTIEKSKISRPAKHSQYWSAAMHADAKQTDFCVYLSAILLVGLLLNSPLEFGWANPVAVLAMTPTQLTKSGVGVEKIRQSFLFVAQCSLEYSAFACFENGDVGVGIFPESED
jgi:hypothetical protein